MLSFPKPGFNPAILRKGPWPKLGKNDLMSKLGKIIDRNIIMGAKFILKIKLF